MPYLGIPVIDVKVVSMLMCRGNVRIVSWYKYSRLLLNFIVFSWFLRLKRWSVMDSDVSFVV